MGGFGGGDGGLPPQLLHRPHKACPSTTLYRARLKPAACSRPSKSRHERPIFSGPCRSPVNGYLQHQAAMGERALALSYREATRPESDKERTAFREGFSLHASLHLHANYREGLEKLCLYAGRGAIASERLKMLLDGRVSYRMKRPSPDGSSHRVAAFAPRRRQP